MNTHIKLEITNAILVSQNFKTACRVDATKDDGKISKDEARILKKLEKCTDKYIKELNKIMEEA